VEIYEYDISVLSFIFVAASISIPLNPMLDRLRWLSSSPGTVRGIERSRPSSRCMNCRCGFPAFDFLDNYQQEKFYFGGK
jgi:hypothetical protein